jgi:hypothetical protein
MKKFVKLLILILSFCGIFIFPFGVSAASPAVVITQPDHGITKNVTEISDIPISFINKDFYSNGVRSLHILVTAKKDATEIIREEDITIVGDNDQHTYNWIISGQQPGSYTIKIEVTPNQTGDPGPFWESVDNSININLTGGAAASVTITTSASPGASSTITAGQTQTPPGSSNGSDLKPIAAPSIGTVSPNWASLWDLFTDIPNILFIFINVALIAAYATGGYLYLTAAGNQEGEEKAKKIFLFATIGLIVVYSAYVLLSQFFHLIPGLNS